MATTTALNLIGYHLSFDAEFTNASDLALFTNSYQNGDTTLYNNHEAENYVPFSTPAPNNPYTLANGALTITASPIPSNGLPYSSGLISTANSFSQNQGYFEIRAETPNVQGFWDAFWMLPEHAYNPEIDILEQPMNSGVNSQYWTFINTPSDHSGGFTDVGTNVYSGYHTYGFLWTANSIQFVFDGQLVGFAHDTPPALVAEKMFLIANLAVGGQSSWPGQPQSGATDSFSIDYIRAYSMDPSVASVPLETISSPDGANTAPTLTAPTVPVPAPIGSGPDQLVLKIAEDAFNGDALFTISVDGVQQGGTLTAQGLHQYGQDQAFTINGTWGPGPHTVTLDFLNDAYGTGPTGGDRNLYLDSATFEGQSVANSTFAQYSGGAQSFQFVAPPSSTAPQAISFGSGPDQLVLQIDGDAYLGVNPQFTIYVDGTEVDGVQTATASRAAGQTQTYTINGTYGGGQHVVTINFLNNDDGPTGDRNLFVASATFNGAAVNNAALNEWSGGPQSFTFPGNPAESTQPTTPAAVTIGTGPDIFRFSLSEDAYLGDAQYTISVDGMQQGGTLTEAANHAAGMSQTVSVAGNFGTGPHAVTINFLNDAYGGTATTDRNLYVGSIAYNGTAVANSNLALMSSGPQTVAVPASQPVTQPGNVPDTLTLRLSEDAYQGDAMARITVDGVVVGSPTITFLHSSGTSQTFSYTGNFGGSAVPHDIGISFLNDNGGTGPTDRNLYVDGLSFDGNGYAADTAALYTTSTVHFAIPAVATTSSLAT